VNLPSQWTRMLILVCFVTVVSSPAQTFITLANFSGTNGIQPMYVTLAQGFDGNFYGTTSLKGGPQNGGMVFMMTPEGSLSVLHSFGSLDGYSPAAGVVLAADGSFYGATANGGGVPACGTLFNISPGGTFALLHSFDMTDGCNPYATLVQATDGNL